MKRLWPLGLLVLAACQPQNPTKVPATVPADAPASAATNAPTISDFSQPMTALGTEPFWSLSIDGTRFKLSRPGEPDVIASAPGAAIRPGQATWAATSDDGQRLAVTLYVSPCSDGMSDRTYPMTAEVTLGSAPTLRGCAVKMAEMPAEDGARARQLQMDTG